MGKEDYKALRRQSFIGFANKIFINKELYMNQKQTLKKQLEDARLKILNLGPVKVVIISFLVVATVASYVFYDYIFGENSVFNQTYDSEFLTEVMCRVPQIVKSVQIVTIAIVVMTIIVAIISAVFTKNRRSITVARIVCNLIKWVTIAVVLIYVLAAWGVNTTALVTGAGVLTLVVGLGMQSLIADVVAGLFIVFENEFNIGDIITIDGFRGEVVEMGIRTMKLKALGNVKIFNNSDVRQVLNQTVEPSVAKALVDIEYGADLGKVEQIIAENLPKLEIEGVIGEVGYDGVNQLGASGVQLQFTAKCQEENIYKVQRLMNRDIKNMFDTHGINIPFNQIVVHKASN